VSRKFFDFARIKREDLFEVVALQQLSPATPEQNKNTRVSEGRHNRVASSLPLSCLFKKDGR
jgi:hypothetical protein